MNYATADLCDAHEGEVLVPVLPGLRDFGGRIVFHGVVSTIVAFEDNSRVREAVAESGKGRVLVVDAGSSLRRAMLGDLLAAKAVENGWEGIVILGAIRDSAAIAQLNLGVKALGVCPRKTEKLGAGQRDVPLELGGIVVRPGQFAHADADGIVFSASALTAPE
ncbi:MAG: ribonuclease E activity regulator RraA [Lysobacteraceae bacterium]